jgi:hypothetical protein
LEGKKRSKVCLKLTVHFEIKRPMTIKTKVTFKEYVKLLFGLAYQRPIMKLLVSVAVLLILWILFYHLNIINLPKPLIYQYITLALLVVVQPTVIYTTIRTVYYSSNQISEPLEMQILPEAIKIHGKSFYMEATWDKMFKIVEKQNWFLIYQNSLSAIIIPKKAMQDEEITSFKKILKEVDCPVELMD